MDTKALFKIGYGLYVLSAHEEGKDNACIINAAMQVTSNPVQISIAVNKNNYTTGIISRTKKFNLSILDESATFDIFKRFGYQSGENIDKFATFEDKKYSNNGVFYLTKNVNARISAYVKTEIDLGTHILFIGQLVDAEVMSDLPTMTYDYYQKNIKPTIQTSPKSKGWRCTICGYVYENEVLPQDFICPICKHGVIDFEKIV